MADLAQTICQAQQVYVEQALNLQAQGVPLDTAERMVWSVLRAQGPRLYWFLIDSIDAAYYNPNQIQKQLQDGSWVVACSQVVMGR